jgi:hypothetical protein
MQHDALIGHTGFVGGTLLRQRPFGALYNSSNIGDIRGGSFNTIVCAGVSAVKWLANKEPEKDKQGIAHLMSCLDGVSANRFVLISTIDVYLHPNGLSEHDIPAKDGLHPYGLHRLELEEFVARRFPRHSIVRLPALFGTGLKKNALYDLIHRNQTEKIVPNAAFQWYPTRRLADDLDRCVAADLPLLNVTAEPIRMDAIRDRFFPGEAMGPAASSPPLYDLRTIHDGVLGGRGGYHFSASEILEEMELFIDGERRSS